MRCGLMVAVFFGGEPRDSEFAAVDAQPRNVHGFRRCGICNLNDLLKVFVGLRLSRAYLSRSCGGQCVLGSRCGSVDGPRWPATARRSA